MSDIYTHTSKGYKAVERDEQDEPHSITITAAGLTVTLFESHCGWSAFMKEALHPDGYITVGTYRYPYQAIKALISEWRP